jgi:hypothetical protein
VLVDDSLLERDNRIVRDRDSFWTYRRATLRDITVADTIVVLEFAASIFLVLRMHLEGRDVDQIPGPHELLVLFVFTQDMA